MKDYISVELYSGRVLVGSAICDDFNDAMKFVEDDGLADKAVIVDTRTNKKYSIKITDAGIKEV